jgi:DNA-directed RNA polymerase specialized sigma24 family protein
VSKSKNTLRRTARAQSAWDKARVERHAAVKAARADGWTLREIAEVMGVAHSQVASLEHKQVA